MNPISLINTKIDYKSAPVSSVCLPSAVSSFDDLVNMSVHAQRLRMFPSEAGIVHFRNFSTLHPGHSDINNAIYEVLSPEQRLVFLRIHQSIEEGEYDGGQPAILVLDCPPGAGKTFTLSAFAITYKDIIAASVYKTELASIMSRIRTISASISVKKLTMRMFRVSFFQAFNKYTPDTEEVDILIRLLLLVRQSCFVKLPAFKTLIIDEFTVIGPELLIAIYLVGRYYGINVVFSGDSQQQTAIEKSPMHMCFGRSVSNSYLLRHLAPISLHLRKVMRCSDVDYNQILDDYRQMIKKYGYGDTRLGFSMEYELFKNLRRNYHMPPNIDACYLAAWHQSLRRRTIDLVQHLTVTETTFFVSKYYGKYTDKSNITRLVPIPNESPKFFMGLVLIPGDFYIYTGSDCISLGRVQLISVLVNDKGDPESVTIRHPSHPGKTFMLGKVTLKQTSILKTLEDAIRLESVFIDNGCDGIVQFPLLTTRVSTFHNAQGLTIVGDVELNFDNAQCESIYVGLSRITSGKHLQKIHSSRTYSLEITHLFEKLCGDTEFFYTASEKEIRGILNTAKSAAYTDDQTVEAVKALNFKEISNPHIFERSKLKPLKIRRSELTQYTANLSTYAETPLERISIFLANSNIRNLVDAAIPLGGYVDMQSVFETGTMHKFVANRSKFKADYDAFFSSRQS
ncbi:MAG: hypothetical protein MUO31_05415 [Thermodesulfovibrionales bacterium]|nr:hypothetical protein [Thermodesulfovibrionales bacterium]